MKWKNYFSETVTSATSEEKEISMEKKDQTKIYVLLEEEPDTTKAAGLMTKASISKVDIFFSFTLWLYQLSLLEQNSNFYFSAWCF